MTKKEEKSVNSAPDESKPEEAPKPGEVKPGEVKPGGEPGELNHTEGTEGEKPFEIEFPVVAVGASAGGLHAIEGLLRNLPDEPGMAFIILQHLSPNRKSIMESLLREYTKLPVVLIEDGMVVEPDRVYVRPSDRRLTIRRGRLVLEELSASIPRQLIDTFLFDLAEDLGENAACVILSGAGSDGSQGLRAINAAGGLVIVQDDHQAEHRGMPHAAIDTGVADFVLPVEKIGEKLVDYKSQSHKTRREMKKSQSERQLEKDMGQILRIVRQTTGHDFSRYKQNTISRRIERRMALHNFDRPGDYAAFLRQDSTESHALFNDLLINVTNFFRDPQAYAALEKELFTRLQKHPAKEPVRVWAPGCATGEEAYSLAMLLVEIMDRLDRRFPIKVFATDINLKSIQTGREGLYPESIAGEMPEQRLKRFFTEKDGRYRVSGQIREMVLFSPHNVASDPPFSQLDLVSCRNLLIYMDRELQRRVLPLLHYSLKEGGLLFLGTSEDVGEFADLFTPVDKKWKIFRAVRALARRHHEAFGILGRARETHHETIAGAEAHGAVEHRPRSSANRSRESMRDVVEKAIFEEYAPPGVLVDGNNRILYFHGDLDRYLTPPRGEAIFDLISMARNGLGGEIRNLLNQAYKSAGRTVHKGARVPLGHQVGIVDIAARKIPGRHGGEERILVTFRAQEDPSPGENGEDPDARTSALQRELNSTRQDLQATIEMLETTNEEMQSTNEELQANNEELQSTNEELETSREELQSTNEELETVNAELQRKNEEMMQAKDDMNNLLAATDVCTVILDSELHIQRFTPAATRIFRLIETDRGRPITDIASILLYDDLPKDLKEAIESLTRKDREVKTREGKWFDVRILPYRTSRNVIAGAVLTLVEITRIKTLELEAREGRVLAESTLETLREPLLVLEEDLRVVTANRAFCNYFRTGREKTENVPVYRIGEQQWDLPDLRRLLERVVSEEEEIFDFPVEGEFPQLGHRSMLLNARRIERGEERPGLILLSFEDVSQKKGQSSSPGE